MPILEEEAKQKWCPFARIEPAGGAIDWAVTNRGVQLSLFAIKENPSSCIGSQCMAWGLFNGKSGYCKLVDK